MPNEKGNLPLHQAVRKKHWDIAALLAPSSDLAWKDTQGKDSLDHWRDVNQRPLAKLSESELMVWKALRELPSDVWAGRETALSSDYKADFLEHRWAPVPPRLVKRARF